MKKIAVLVDFTTTCLKASEFAGKIASKTNAVVVFVHVASTSDKEQEESLLYAMDQYKAQVPKGINVEHYIDYGSFYSLIPNTVVKLEVDMVVVGTHGKSGIMQNLFGANILKLIKSLKIPSLVVQDDSVIDENTFSNLLFPIAPHEHFEIKYQQVSELAKIFDSTVHIIAIRKDIRGMSDHNVENLKRTIEYFKDNQIKYVEVREDANEYSVGYAKQILKYANNSGMGTICIMSKVSKDNHYFGNIDKENILLNASALPVYCANDVTV